MGKPMFKKYRGHEYSMELLSAELDDVRLCIDGKFYGNYIDVPAGDRVAQREIDGIVERAKVPA